jgi:PIN domain nuclease of toxin-antitoxin system
VTSGLLLDTCACLWLTHDDPMSPAGLRAIEEATEARLIFVSAITAWEVATLVRKGRYRLRASPEGWFTSLLARPGVNLAHLTPAILIESVFLPGEPPADPADRMIAAGARLEGLAVVTRDKQLRAYASAGHISVVEC